MTSEKAGLLERANGWIVGIREPDLETIYGGYDQAIWMQDHPDAEMSATAQELVALADRMIVAWRARRDLWAKDL